MDHQITSRETIARNAYAAALLSQQGHAVDNPFDAGTEAHVAWRAAFERATTDAVEGAESSA